MSAGRTRVLITVDLTFRHCEEPTIKTHVYRGGEAISLIQWEIALGRRTLPSQHLHRAACAKGVVQCDVTKTLLNQPNPHQESHHALGEGGFLNQAQGIIHIHLRVDNATALEIDICRGFAHD